MQSRNPVFTNSKAFSNKGHTGVGDVPQMNAGQLEDMYRAPAATGVDTGRMTMDDVVVKTGLMFAVLVPLAIVNYVLQNPLLTIGGALVGLVVGLIVSFKQSTNPVLMLTYAALEGLFVGGMSGLYEARYNGIVGQAVLGSLSVFLVALWAYKSGRVRATPKFQKTVMIAMGGYLIFSLINVVLVLTTHQNLRGGVLGIGIGLFAVTLAAAMLILDFDFAEQGVRNGLPERYSWLAAFGLVVTLVWLYLEMLRLIGSLRGRN